MMGVSFDEERDAIHESVGVVAGSGGGAVVKLFGSSVVAIGALSALSCAHHIPEPVGVESGAPHMSWDVMYGPRENPEENWVCQSDPSESCTLPASRPDAPIFSTVHLYFHPGATETKYTGTVRVGFFGENGGTEIPESVTVKPKDTVGHSSVTGLVTSKPGTHEIRVTVVGTPARGTPENIVRQGNVVVK